MRKDWIKHGVENAGQNDAEKDLEAPIHLPMKELIPNAFQSSSIWKGKFVYALEWEYKSNENSQSKLPKFTRWLQASIDYMNTFKGPITFGIVLEDQIPNIESFPSIFIPTRSSEEKPHYLGNERIQEGFECRLKLLDYCLDERSHSKLLAMQTKLFGLLSVRPLFLEELLSKANINMLEKEWIPDEKRSVYMIAPLIREGFSYEPFNVSKLHTLYETLDNGGHPFPDYSSKNWLIDWGFLEKLSGEDKQTCISVRQALDELDALQDHDHIFSEYCLKQGLLVNPHDGMNYRLRRLHHELCPNSPFETDAIPEANTYWEYAKLRYNLSYDLSHEEMNRAPLLGLAKIESLADFSRWTFCPPEDEIFLSASLESLKKKPKQDTEGKHEEKRHKSAHIPTLTRISTVPYAVIRALLLVPRIVWILEAQLLALDFYNTPSLKGCIPYPTSGNQSALIASMTTSSSMQPSNYERLELLGDSFLKAAISIDIFLKDKSFEIGQLNNSRISQVNNNRLAHVGFSLGVHRYAQIAAFSPKLWAPPSLKVSLNGLNDLEFARAQRLFDPELKWRALADLDKKSASSEMAYDYTPMNNETNGLGIQDESLSKDGIKRMGQIVSNKTIADLVEASVGAVFEVFGWYHCIEYVVKLGLIEHNIWENPTVKGLGEDEIGPRKQSTASNDVQSSSSISVDVIDYEEIETRIKYKFKDRSLLLAALTHVSAGQLPCSEKLEWLGDALVDWSVTKYYYLHMQPPLSPFELSEARRAMVNNVALSKLAISLGLHKYLRITHSGISNEIARYAENILCSQGTKCGPSKELADLFEAIMGAVFLDCHLNIDVVDRVICGLVLEHSG